jgi:hypothetical protein
LFALSAPFVLIIMTFAESKSCSQLVIDTYAMHAKINIPKVLTMNCYYDESAALCVSVFDLKKEVSLAKFKLVDHDQALRVMVGMTLLNQEEKPFALCLAMGEKWEDNGHTFLIRLRTDFGPN